jgi:hypothetical protein
MVKGNDVIPRHSPKLGTSQGDANTNDELLLRWWWCDHDWDEKILQHPAKPVVFLLKYLHLHPQNSIFIAKLIGDPKGFLCCSARAEVWNWWYWSLHIMRKSTSSVN